MLYDCRNFSPNREKKPQGNARTIFNVTSGNFLEMFDFMVFGYYATAIAKTFFPGDNPFASLMLTLMTFGAGFLMRPLGAIVLGSYIDHHGRRKGLLVTLGLMAIGTLTIAVVPGYNTLGAAAPILILLGRLLQGFSAGVELGGVSVYLAEIAPKNRKGFYVSWQSGSQQVAVIFAALLGLGLNHLLAKDQVTDWGWRIPFVIGCLIVPFLFWIRSTLEETEAFAQRKVHPSMKQIVRSVASNWGLVLAGMLMVVTTTVMFYMITAFTPTFGKTVLMMSDKESFFVTLCVGISNLIWLPIMGSLSDRYGRRPMLIFYSADDCHRVAGAALAGGGAFLSSPAGSRAVALLPLRQLQRRDGGISGRGDACRSARHRLLAGLQSGNRAVWRLYPGRLQLPDPRYRRQSDAGRMADLCCRLRPDRHDDYQAANPPVPGEAQRRASSADVAIAQ